MSSVATQNDRFLTLGEAAELIRGASETVRYWIHVGKLRAYKPGRRVLVKETELRALVEGAAIDHRPRASRRSNGEQP